METTNLNEYLSLIAQIAGIAMSAGIAIFAFRFPILREGAEVLPEATAAQYSRLRNKTNTLFIGGAVTVFMCILLKIGVSFISDRSLLLILLIVFPLGALAMTYIFLHSLFEEI